GLTGAFATPYAGYWSTCTVQWTSPDNITPDTRITFQNWNDAGNVNPRAFALNPDPKVTNAFTGNFVTEYLLTANAIPVSGGTIGAGGWYAAGTTVGVFASVNSGFVFTGFSGALTGAANPQPLLMNGPKSVTAGFSTVPPSTMTASIVTKNGAASSRFWAIQLTNAGPGVAYGAQVFVLSFVQTFGTACTSLPVRLSPATLPSILGTLSPGQSVLSTFSIDFSGCPANARFTVNLGYMSNGGASG